MEKITLAAGCFWGIEDTFRRIKGVISTRVGYMGGHVANATYKQVCSGETGHAEVVEVTYDPNIVSYPDLLEVFWKSHNPTTLNRQGPDVGTQYRSVIFFHNEQQQKQALESKKNAQQFFSNEIVTEIKQAPFFVEAEEYHQQYHQKHGGSCNL